METMMRMEQNVDECHQRLEYRGTPESRTEEGEDRKLHTINFRFSCNPVYIYVIMTPRQGDVSDDSMYYEELDTITKSIRVDLGDLDDWRGACEKLDELLIDFPMNYEMREGLMKFVVDTAKGILVSSGHHLLDLHIPFEICHEHIFVENVAATVGIGYDSPRVSETEDSILTRCLKKRKVMSSCEEYGRCVICLEDFYKDCEGLCMPCSHLFHGDCIKTWLKTSRCCPLCRIELPTS